MTNKLSRPSRGIKSAAIAMLMTSIFGWVSAVHALEVRQQEQGDHNEVDHFRPTGKGFGVPDPSGTVAGEAQRFSKPSNNGIFYHGGPVMLGTANLYYIWYGAWDPADSAKMILTSFGSYIGGTPYFNINKTYYDSNNTAVSGLVTYLSSATDGGSQGTALTDSAVQQIVASAIGSGQLPIDSNGVYFVLTSKEVTETSGFCTQYCAWHSHGTVSGVDVKYGFIGNPAQCPAACSAQSTTPNGNMAADAMANLIAHELAEAVTDPDLNAWFDRRGFENADKCAWKFGTTSTLSSGAKYNVSFGSMNWLLQQNWINAGGGYCTLK